MSEDETDQPQADTQQHALHEYSCASSSRNGRGTTEKRGRKELRTKRLIGRWPGASVATCKREDVLHLWQGRGQEGKRNRASIWRGKTRGRSRDNRLHGAFGTAIVFVGHGLHDRTAEVLRRGGMMMVVLMTVGGSGLVRVARRRFHQRAQVSRREHQRERDKQRKQRRPRLWSRSVGEPSLTRFHNFSRP